MSDRKQVLKFHYYFVNCTEGNNLANFVVDSNRKLELLLENLTLLFPQKVYPIMLF